MKVAPRFLSYHFIAHWTREKQKLFINLKYFNIYSKFLILKYKINDFFP